MPDAIQTLIALLDQSRVSSNQQPVVVSIDAFVAALNEIEVAIGGGIIPSTIVLPNTEILVGNASNVGAAVALSGDATITNTGNMTVNTFGAAQSGKVPASGGGTSNFLRADGTWAAIPAGATGANPTATAGPVAINGVASTFMRSDAAPAIQLGTNAAPGIIQGDGGSTINITGGVISVPVATATQQGGVTIDNITIKATGNKISVINNVLAHPGFASGRHYTGPTAGSLQGLVMSINTLYTCPIFVPTPTTITNIAINFNGGTPGNIALGIYNNNNGIPGTLLLDCGRLATGGGGLNGKTISQLLQGWYWLAVASDSAVNIEALSGFDINNYTGWDPNNISQLTGISGPWTYSVSALPSPFPSPAWAAATASPAIFLSY